MTTDSHRSTLAVLPPTQQTFVAGYVYDVSEVYKQYTSAVISTATNNANLSMVTKVRTTEPIC